MISMATSTWGISFIKHKKESSEAETVRLWGFVVCMQFAREVRGISQSLVLFIIL
jgi:hypothetical protein